MFEVKCNLELIKLVLSYIWMFYFKKLLAHRIASSELQQIFEKDFSRQ